VRATRRRRAPVGLGRRRRSPGGGRRGVGDDAWDPRVSDRGRRRRGGLAAVVSWAGWAARPLGCNAREERAAATTAAGPAAAAGLLRGRKQGCGLLPAGLARGDGLK
jgi:hypothetical protein